ncbi:hypothetical protein RM572_09040 [Streptomyces sp. DSM 42041]|uniref:Transmembrane protein n=1 Tax=Streptomyces hazeniae TaxID=3075538 RepID=A0ABU2NPK8_9ACTN|nr:hypothetical protein [Streptomyces sp. DSM 42041]MDT0378916.1 hypothetical protein [Streptomyces sp. DSM 42041]
MHMNSAPQLLREDRAEFERLLDETLRTADRYPGLSRVGDRLGRAQLRSMAVSAALPIAACADAEYRRFVALRRELRERANDATATVAGRDGAGLLAIVSVLAPLLAGTAALIFLLVGYGLHLLDPEPSLAAPMRNAGWTFAVLAAGTALLGMGGVLLTALRNGPSAVAAPGRPRRRRGPAPEPASVPGDLAQEVAAARSAWQTALRDRGIVPFLREALADPAGAEKSPEALARELPEQPRTPRLGYSHPGFSHPGFSSPATGSGSDSASTRPRFSSPEFAAPDYDGPAYGGPETQPE